MEALEEKIAHARYIIGPFVFKNPPTRSGDNDVPIHEELEVSFNAGVYPLQEEAAENGSILDYQRWLIRAFYATEDAEELKDVIMAELERLERLKGQEWERQRIMVMHQAEQILVRTEIPLVDIGEQS